MTTAPRQIEENANNALGELLRGMLSGCEVRCESTRTIRERRAHRADILITGRGRAPVVVEAEYEPGASVEDDARSRLGRKPVGEPRPIESAIALRYPPSIESAYDIAAAVAAAQLSYCVAYADGSRFPESGWLSGSVADLADLISLSAVPQSAVNAAADELERGIDDAQTVLEEVDKLRPGITSSIAVTLGMSNVPQTRRMACAIMANAITFHQRIAGMHQGIKPLRQVCGPEVPDPQEETLAAWEGILAINYWPIFAIAKDVLSLLTPGYAADVLAALRETAQRIDAAGVNNAHDLTGRIFQRLISDRKYLATFYTLPPSAALLARLAVAKMEGVDWSDAGAIGKLRIGDFACGTGALLSAVYEQIASRHERAGGDPASLHQVMMEDALYGCDVMPSAIHITGSTLSGVRPEAGFNRSRLYTLAYGRQIDGSVKIGSLELLQSSALPSLFNTSDPALRTTGVGEEMAAYVTADIPDGGFDLVIMNPPFTSDTKHYDAASGVLAAAFAAFNASVEEQDKMAARLRQRARGTCYHGHAGLGSAFAALAARKIRPNGIIALVLPFTAINGASWAKFRELIATEYTDVTIVSIAANGKDMSFSSDTGIAECLVIARRIASDKRPKQRAQFVSLTKRPANFAAAAELSKAILAGLPARRLEDGPYGGVPIRSGDAAAGEALEAPLTQYESGWGAARILDAATAQVAHSLSLGKLWLPAEPEALDLPIAHLNQVGQRGLDSQLFISSSHNGPFIQGPRSSTATYPSLWNHSAKRETRFVCEPDSQLRVKPGMESRAAELWETASRAHLNRDFRFNSQPLAAAFTEQSSIGGRAWPNILFADARVDFMFTLWCNSTLGLLLFWWHSNLQQGGRGMTTIRSLESLSVLDFRALSGEQLLMAESIFDEFRGRELKPAYLADADPNRALLDRRVVCDLLGFGEETYRAVRRLSAKWCAEPSVHGGKTRPRDAVFAV